MYGGYITSLLDHYCTTALCAGRKRVGWCCGRQLHSTPAASTEGQREPSGRYELPAELRAVAIPTEEDLEEAGREQQAKKGASGPWAGEQHAGAAEKGRGGGEEADGGGGEGAAG